MTTADANTTPGQAQEYPWRLAPAHLKTRRQLRAVGLQPNRQPVAALMVGKRRGRRLVAHLYDLAKAAPKKPATAAQLAAAAAATREHQARAAERHGISRSDLATGVEPAAGWDTPATTEYQEGNRMSDTTTGQTEQPRLGTAYGHDQRMALLLATIAVNRARDLDDRLFRQVEHARAQGPDAIADLDTRAQHAISRAEERLETIAWDDRSAVVGALTDALVWRSNSETIATRLDEITTHYARTWGVRIDADELTASVDPSFDAVTAQQARDDAGVRARESYALDIVAAMPVTGRQQTALHQALRAWRDGVDPNAPAAFTTTAAARREQLGADLAAAKLSESDRARVEFVVDYLRADTTNLDLQAAPVLVDPGEEARSRVPRLLGKFARNPEWAPEVGQAISVMTPADQQQVNQVGKAIVAGQHPDHQLWPGYVDRAAVDEQLYLYAVDAEDLRADADALAEGRFNDEERTTLGQTSPTMSDETSDRIVRMSAARTELLDQARTGKGLASMERAQIIATVADIDAGRIAGRAQLPELMWADELTRSEMDSRRIGVTADRLATATKEAITQRIEATGAIEPGSRAEDRLTKDVDSIGSVVRVVVNGSRSTSLEQKRAAFVERRGRLEQDLTRAGVQVSARAEIRGLVDARGKEAGQLGQTAEVRRKQWHTRTAQAVTARDTAAARRAAVDAGEARPASRACATPPTRTAGQAASTGRAARIAQLHTQEVGR